MMADSFRSVIEACCKSLPRYRLMTKIFFSSYDPEVHEKGALTQSATSFRLFDSVSPTVVFFIPTQKTSATKKTMSEYSTKPCPSVSANNLLKTFTLDLFRPFQRWKKAVLV
jgi:hypothetical protein